MGDGKLEEKEMKTVALLKSNLYRGASTEGGGGSAKGGKSRNRAISIQRDRKGPTAVSLNVFYGGINPMKKMKVCRKREKEGV